MKEKIDLSLNRSLEELISSYWEVENDGIESSAFYALENYLSDMGALWYLENTNLKIGLIVV